MVFPSITKLHLIIYLNVIYNCIKQKKLVNNFVGNLTLKNLFYFISYLVTSRFIHLNNLVINHLSEKIIIVE